MSSVASPFAAGNAAQISSSGRIGFAKVILDKQGITFTVSQAKRFVAVVRAGASGGLSVAVEGQVAEQTVTNSVSRAGFALGVGTAVCSPTCSTSPPSAPSWRC